MKKLIALFALLLATAAHAAPLVHLSVTGTALTQTTDADTLHISLTGNDTHEHIGILWFLVAIPPQLKRSTSTVDDFRYQPGVFWNVPPTDQTGDSVLVDPYGRTVYLFTMNAYQPGDSCNTRAANAAGEIGTILIRLRSTATSDANYAVGLSEAFSTLPGLVFPPAVPWTQLCFLQNGAHQPGVPTDGSADVTITALGDSGGGGGCHFHCDDPAIVALRAGKPVEWFDVSGRRLGGKPASKGIYFVRLAGRPGSRTVVVR